MDSNEIVLSFPHSVKSEYVGYGALMKLLSPYLDEIFAGRDFILDFQKNVWFDANLLPILYAYIVRGTELGIHSSYGSDSQHGLYDVLVRNGFAKQCFGAEHRPHLDETCVPFKVFKASATYDFGRYIDAELVRYFPAMESRVQKDLSGYIQEIFGNAQIHAGSGRVFTCGQFYPKKRKMDFTIVDLGWTFQNNVIDFFNDRGRAFDGNTIFWAVQPNHSTKAGVSGGLGLSLIRDFIKANKGKFQIVSGNEYWELDKGNEGESTFAYSFPGTIVNIEIDQNDRNYYFYGNSFEANEDIF